MSIAPNLKRFLVVGALPAKSKSGAWTPASSALWVEAHRELRALLAVAKAADEVIGSDPCACGNQCCDNNKISRALSRLARLSSPRGIPFEAVLAKQMKDPEFAREYRKAKARGTRRAKRRTR